MDRLKRRRANQARSWNRPEASACSRSSKRTAEQQQSSRLFSAESAKNQHHHEPKLKKEGDQRRKIGRNAYYPLPEAPKEKVRRYGEPLVSRFCRGRAGGALGNKDPARPGSGKKIAGETSGTRGSRDQGQDQVPGNYYFSSRGEQGEDGHPKKAEEQREGDSFGAGMGVWVSALRRRGVIKNPHRTTSSATKGNEGTSQGGR